MALVVDDGKLPNQYEASQGIKNIIAAAENAAGADSWNAWTMLSKLLDDEDVTPQSVWKPEELRRFENYKLPCWVLRCVQCRPTCFSPREISFSNSHTPTVQQDVQDQGPTAPLSNKSVACTGLYISS